MASQTSFVSGLPRTAVAADGNPAPKTALGVYLGIRAAVQFQLGRDTLAGLTIGVQGLGGVGFELCRILAAEGARLTLADVDTARARALADELGARVAGTDEIMGIEADVFSPNALGAILDEYSIPRLAAGIVAGGANNQLATAADGQRLHDRGILYAPDYVINAGGIINVALEYLGHGDRAEVEGRIGQILDRLRSIWMIRNATGRPAAIVADDMARALIGRG